MVGINETAGHRALLAVIRRAGSPSGLRTTPNTGRECLSDPVLRSEIPHIPGLDSIKHLPADYGGTAPAMMWRNGRFLPGNGGAALL